MLALMLSDAQRRFLDTSRVAHLATADARGVPHLVPVCFAVGEVTTHLGVECGVHLSNRAAEDDPIAGTRLVANLEAL